MTFSPPPPQVLVDMFTQEEDVTAMMIEDEPVRRESMTYEEIVKDFIMEETQYLRDLNMIIKVFRAPFADLFPRSKVRHSSSHSQAQSPWTDDAAEVGVGGGRDFFQTKKS